MISITKEFWEIPYFLLSEYLTGWTIIAFVIFVIYFVSLRKYYIKKEQFYQEIDTSKNKKNNGKKNNGNKDNDANDDDDDEKNNKSRIFEIENKLSDEQNNYNTKNKKPKKYYQNNIKEKGKNVFEGFQSTETTTTNTNTNTSTNTTTNTNTDITFISTTLFDNLNLNPAQLQSTKLKYNEIIAQTLIKLSNLNKLFSNNQYLNIKKEFNVIITNAIDSIINYLNDDIKAINILTRTSIRTDIINVLSSTLEYLTEKENKTLIKNMNKLAVLNSTTIDYNTMLSTIEDSRKKLEDYKAIDTLITKYASNVLISQREINKVLDKSLILPIYERNFDRINQILTSDFNDNEDNLSKKYGAAYTEYLQQEKKAELDINPLRLGSQIESGILSMLANPSNKNYNDSNEDILEQYTKEYGYIKDTINEPKNNPIPRQQQKLISETTLNNSNIYKDIGNRGNYIIDNETQKQILEGFQNNNSSNKTNNNNNKKNNKNNNGDIISNIMNGNILNYAMDFTNEKIGQITSIYNNKMGTNTGSDTMYNIEENLIPAGFLLFILSMLFYFVDVTS
jgi:hypothetical protein